MFPSKKIKNKNKGFLKIGELAKETGVLPSTIHFYTNEGLLKPADWSKGGYRLYEPSYAVLQIKKIQQLQSDKRLTIAELKQYFK